MIYEYLKNSAFLKKMDEMPIKEQFVKIIVLDFLENPITEIQGKVTSGSINLNGSSAVRRTANLNMVADDANNDIRSINNLLSINKKIKLEIGFTNMTSDYQQYPIIWFPLGVYIIITPSIVHNNTGINISLQLKDKMCLLNGDCGGVLPASITFHETSYEDDKGNIVIERIKIYNLIQELVNHWGKEQLGKIIISDIDTRIKKVMKWKGSTPLYMGTITSGNEIQYDVTTNLETAKQQWGTAFKTYETQQDVGYIYTDFVYTDDLIGNAGDSVCTILDKIKNYLGNYEYFYDIDGNFIFQEIKNYLNTSKATVDIQNLSNSDYLTDFSNGKSVYTFDGSKLNTSFTMNPQYNIIKNDYIVWGIKTTSDKTKIPIRYHLAIDKKPQVGNTYTIYLYEDDDIIKAKKLIEYDNLNDFPSKGTYGLYYLDKTTQKVYTWINGYIEQTKGKIKTIVTKDWRTELYLAGTNASNLGLDSNDYYSELQNEWPKLYDLEKQEFKESVLNDPTSINYFLDFIDSTAAISELSIKNIGKRSKVISNNDINCIFASEIPNLILIEKGQEDTAEKVQECQAVGQDFIQVSSMIYAQLGGGGQSYPAYSQIRELLYQYTNYNESISMSAIPVYYLEPNTRITVRDDSSKIYGDYVIKTITLPLDISSTMNIQATKALERF